MRKIFDRKTVNHGQVLEFARTFSKSHNVKVWVATNYEHDISIVYSCAGVIPGISGGSNYSGFFGWWFGGCCKFPDDFDPSTLTEQEPFPKEIEHYAQIVASYTSGFSPKEWVDMAKSMVDNSSCVWHEAAALRNAKCFCASCA